MKNDRISAIAHILMVVKQLAINILVLDEEELTNYWPPQCIPARNGQAPIALH